jgi:hypothetical protein
MLVRPFLAETQEEESKRNDRAQQGNCRQSPKNPLSSSFAIIFFCVTHRLVLDLKCDAQ